MLIISAWMVHVNVQSNVHDCKPEVKTVQDRTDELQLSKQHVCTNVVLFLVICA